MSRRLHAPVLKTDPRLPPIFFACPQIHAPNRLLIRSETHSNDLGQYLQVCVEISFLPVRRVQENVTSFTALIFRYKVRVSGNSNALVLNPTFLVLSQQVALEAGYLGIEVFRKDVESLKVVSDGS